jgi:hypothetical protein
MDYIFIFHLFMQITGMLLISTKTKYMYHSNDKIIFFFKIYYCHEHPFTKNEYGCSEHEISNTTQ